MSVVEQIMRRNHVTIMLDEIPYLCHKMSSQLMLEALGPAVLGSVLAGARGESGGGDSEQDVERSERGASVTLKLLRVAMISPRLADADDPEADTVTWLTMGDHATKLYNKLMSGESEKIEGFPESCAEPTEA